MITEAIVKHIFIDIKSMISPKFFLKDLELVENENDIIAKIYVGKFANENKFLECFCCIIDDNQILILKSESDKIWLISNMDNNYIISNPIESINNTSVKNQAQFLLAWENLVDSGWNFKPDTIITNKFFEILENFLEE